MLFKTRLSAAGFLVIMVVVMACGGSAASAQDDKTFSNYLKFARMTSGYCRALPGGPDTLGFVMEYASLVPETYEIYIVNHPAISGSASGSLKALPPGFPRIGIPLTVWPAVSVPWEMEMVVDAYINGKLVTRARALVGCRGENGYYQTPTSFTRFLPLPY